MSKKNATVSVRIEPEIKAQAEAILAKKGTTPTMLINTLYNQIAFCKGIPFEMKIPKAKPAKKEEEGN